MTVKAEVEGEMAVEAEVEETEAGDSVAVT